MDAINISYYSLWQQTTRHIMEEDILNYSPTVMFRGTPTVMFRGTPTVPN